MSAQNLLATTASGQIPLAALQDPTNSLIQVVSQDHSRAVYRYSGLLTLAVATPTAVLVIQGGAKTSRVRRIGLSGWGTTEGTMKALVIRRKTAGTLGSAVLTAVTAALSDTGTGSAPTTVVSTVGTANYTTLGTTAGQLGCGVLTFPKAATIGAGQGVICWPHGNQGDAGQSFVLRGSADWITVELNGDAVPAGGVLLYEIEIEEDAS